MGILSKIVGGATGSLVDGVADAVDRFVDTKGEKEERELKMMLAQLKVNEEEAKHASIFVAGWRPFCGWVCAGGLAVVLAVTVASWAIGWRTADEIQDLVMAIGPFYGPVLLGMLGLRTVEKAKKLTGRGK